ncbi:uncharacterized protein LOC141900444 [Tubulanus polymorphus]|uniref:uncharacterized protein LOC141900444 n=1 Tax=Tubulanus polymorphus TaxID=672921 RepID=UPI003DA57A5E
MCKRVSSSINGKLLLVLVAYADVMACSVPCIRDIPQGTDFAAIIKTLGGSENVTTNGQQNLIPTFIHDFYNMRKVFRNRRMHWLSNGPKTAETIQALDIAVDDERTVLKFSLRNCVECYCPNSLIKIIFAKLENAAPHTILELRLHDKIIAPEKLENKLYVTYDIRRFLKDEFDSNFTLELKVKATSRFLRGVTDVYYLSEDSSNPNNPIIVAFGGYDRRADIPIVNKRFETTVDEDDSENHNRQTRSLETLDTDCRLWKWNISWSEIEAADHIVVPRFVQAAYCSGKCEDGILNRRVSFASSAVIRMLSRKKPELGFLPPPKCVPAMFKSLDVIMKAKPHGTIRLITVPDLIPTVCRCY